MSERTCPSCEAIAPPRLKFCRECGSRLPDAVEDPSPVRADAGDGTIIQALPRRVVEDPPADDDEADVDGDAGSDGGDRTMLSGSAALRRAIQGQLDRGGGSAGPEAAVERTQTHGGTRGGAPVPTVVHRREDPAAEPPGGETVLSRRGAAADPGPVDGGGDDSTAAGLPVSPTLLPGEYAAPPGAVPEEHTDTFVGSVPPASLESTRAPERPSRTEAPPAEIEEEEEEEFTFDAEGDGGAPADEAVEEDDLPATVLGRPAEPVTPPIPLPPPSPRASADAPPAPARRTGPVRMEHWSPTRKRSVLTMDRGEAWVGRDKGDWTFPDDGYLSQRHGRFFLDDDGRLVVEDNGTLNGVFLRLKEPVRLEHRDVVQIGRHVLRFEILSNEEEDPRTLEGDPYTRVLGVQGSPPKSRLVKRQDDGFSGMPFFFGTRTYVLGRTSGTHRFTKDDRMSRRHASLTWKEGEYFLEDLGSQNGTFLQIRGQRILDVGDVVKIGEQYFRVV